MKIVLVAIVLACGCTSARRSWRYGDGTPYDGLSGIRLSQKFFVRSVEFRNISGARMPASSLAKYVPELFNAEYHDGDIPIKVVMQYRGWEAKSQFLYTMLSLLSLTIVPFEDVFETYATVDILDDGGVKVVPSTGYWESACMKTSYLLSFGGIPYGVKEGFQCNAIRSSLSEIVTDEKCVELFEKTVSWCVAQQLKKHALDRITTPDVEFNAEKK